MSAKHKRSYRISLAPENRQRELSSRKPHQAPLAFLLALVFGYLFLVGPYERWTLPIGVPLSVVAAAFGAFLALLVRGHANDNYAQIGLVLLIGLAAKNAILVVQFSEGERTTGASVLDAAKTGLAQRFRAVFMTALAFIFGVASLVIASGAGAGAPSLPKQPRLGPKWDGRELTADPRGCAGRPNAPRPRAAGRSGMEKWLNAPRNSTARELCALWLQRNAAGIA